MAGFYLTVYRVLQQSVFFCGTGIAREIKQEMHAGLGSVGMRVLVIRVVSAPSTVWKNWDAEKLGKERLCAEL